MILRESKTGNRIFYFIDREQSYLISDAPFDIEACRAGIPGSHSYATLLPDPPSQSLLAISDTIPTRRTDLRLPQSGPDKGQMITRAALMDPREPLTLITSALFIIDRLD